MSAERLSILYPRLADSRGVFERLDPHGRFANEYLLNVGVRALREHT